ncbi:hypothetical protein [Deinococcus roseus]|uniref:Flp pilus-assembly TadG-like N-terminal domain-containing protein n=1 Tax=Deinococcus roseus TaxID=392414 RepID=A0ABQ2CWH7_9DEIO|nr:hypothetical protein [Deinococcus roseus]GGJ27906.1 hypothetical protein GCM10008938_12470 [Deinococcus roseus]
MFIMAIVLLISAQYTLKTSKTVTDQSATLEAQYVSESGLAWAKAYVKQLGNRLDGLGTTNKTLTDFTTLVASVCGVGQNTTVTSGCTVPTTEPAASAAKTAIADFFRTWEGAPTTDTYWATVFKDLDHTLSLGNGQTYSVYNTYKVGGVLTKSPLFSITRLEWDYTPATPSTISTMNTFRFCYDVGYYVSKGTTTTKGSRVVGQYPRQTTTSTSPTCPTATSAGSSAGSSGDPSRNSLDVAVTNTTYTPSTTTPAITTNITSSYPLAGAVGIEKKVDNGTYVSYEVCGQTSNGNSGACGNDRNYTIRYDYAGANQYQVTCSQNDVTTTYVTLTSPNLVQRCAVKSQGNQTDYVYFLRNSSGKIILILGPKNSGNNTLAGWLTSPNTMALTSNYAGLVFGGDCKGVGLAGVPQGISMFAAQSSGITTGLNIPSSFCTETALNSSATAAIDTTVNIVVPPIVTTGPTTYTYYFDPLTNNINVLYTGRWIQLNNGDL